MSNTSPELLNGATEHLGASLTTLRLLNGSTPVATEPAAAPVVWGTAQHDDGASTLTARPIRLEAPAGITATHYALYGGDGPEEPALITGELSELLEASNEAAVFEVTPTISLS